MAKKLFPRYVSASVRSLHRLETFEFDPIEKLVNKYTELEGELQRQHKLRSGEIVEITASGRPKNFNEETLLNIYDKQISIADKLLRYAYGRVPETEEETEKKTAPLVVNLTQQGDKFIINESEVEDFYEIENDKTS